MITPHSLFITKTLNEVRSFSRMSVMEAGRHTNLNEEDITSIINEASELLWGTTDEGNTTR